MSGSVFVGDHILLDVGLDVATCQLERLAGGGVLLAAAESAYGAGIADLAEVAGIAAEPSRLAGVAPGQLTETVGCTRLALRWEAIGGNGALLPALDADLTLSPAGEQATLLTLAGVYRLPDQLGAVLAPAIVRCFAAVTIRSFVARLACALMRSAEADVPAGLWPGASRPPRPGNPTAGNTVGETDPHAAGYREPAGRWRPPGFEPLLPVPRVGSASPRRNTGVQ